MVARDHLAQLALGVLQGGWIFPVNVPVHRNFRPHHDSHAVGEAGHVLAVRVMGQAHEIAAQFLRPSQQGLRVLRAECTPAADRGFFMHGDTTQKDGLAVEQNLGAASLDGAETNGVVDFVRAARHRDIVEFGMTGRP